MRVVRSYIFLVLFLLSCKNIDRFDPIEASDYILDIDYFRFYSGSNPSLPTNSPGYIDRDNNKIFVPISPSVDFSSIDLTASFYVRSEYYSEYNYDGEYNITQNWSGTNTFELSRSFIDPGFDGTHEYITRYTVYLENRLRATLSWLEYSNEASPVIDLNFNDTVNGKSDLSDFTSGFSGSNFSITSVSSPTSPSSSYTLSLTPVTEGLVSIQVDADVFDEVTTGTLNDASNMVNFIWDISAPTVSASSITVSGLDADDPLDMSLTISFSEATDNVFSQSQLLYSIFYSVGSTENMPDVSSTEVQPAMIWDDSYRSSYTWSYFDLPWDIQTNLYDGAEINFNVLVRDPASNSSVYDDSFLTVTIPASIP